MNLPAGIRTSFMPMELVICFMPSAGLVIEAGGVISGGLGSESGVLVC